MSHNAAPAAVVGEGLGEHAQEHARVQQAEGDPADLGPRALPGHLREHPEGDAEDHKQEEADEQHVGVERGPGGPRAVAALSLAISIHEPIAMPATR